MKIDYEQIIKNLGNKANKIYKDSGKLRELIDLAKTKAEGNKQLMDIWADLKLLIELINDWMKGEYVDLSKSTVIMIIISLIYLVSPIDLIPDFLIGGFIDDALVIGYVVKTISEELNAYKDWKDMEEDVVEETLMEEDIFER